MSVALHPIRKVALRGLSTHVIRVREALPSGFLRHTPGGRRLYSDAGGDRFRRLPGLTDGSHSIDRIVRPIGAELEELLPEPVTPLAEAIREQSSSYRYLVSVIRSMQ